MLAVLVLSVVALVVLAVDEVELASVPELLLAPSGPPLGGGPGGGGPGGGPDIAELELELELELEPAEVDVPWSSPSKV